jgi:hypothetical protein
VTLKELRTLETISFCWLDEWTPLSVKRKRNVFTAMSKDVNISWPAGGRFAVTFERMWAGEYRVFGISYSGPKMDEVLDQLATSVELI